VMKATLSKAEPQFSELVTLGMLAEVTSQSPLKIKL